MNDKEAVLHSSLPFLHMSKSFLPPLPLSRLRTLKVSLLPVNLLMSYTINTSAHLPDVFSVLLSFLDVREDETAADKLHFKINHHCWMVSFLFLV